MIYFAQSTSGGPVKIGHSEDVASRVRALEFYYGRPLALLATMPGDLDTEAAIHERFAHLRFGRTEQFRPAADLMEFIGRPLLVSPNPDAVEALPRFPLVKFDRVLASRARAVARGRGVSLVEYLSAIARGPIDRDYARLLRELEGGPRS